MITEKHIRKLAEQQLKDTDKFLVEIIVRPANRIMVFIDSDEGVTVDDCVGLSRAIEGNFDREEEDFDLTVSSAGLDQPFKIMRQYRKYLNRAVKIEMEDGSKLTAILTGINEDSITIKELITKGKHKKAEEEGPEKELPLSEIKATKPAISFKK
jgi:ribosome maturation factor RimP